MALLDGNDDEVIFDMSITYWVRAIKREVPQKMLAQNHPEYFNEDTAKVPVSLWTTGPYDIGLLKGVGEVKIKLKPGTILPRTRQNPMSREANKGIFKTISGMMDHGILVTFESPCNIAIYPVKISKWDLGD